jgi:benzoyl-CoA 2,3-dioxygenase component B
LRNALNEVLRSEYIKDLRAWASPLEQNPRRGRTDGKDLPCQQALPPARRRIQPGTIASIFTASLISQDEFERRCSEWLPTVQDREYVRSLMMPVIEQGKDRQLDCAPKTGINRQHFDFVYVRL